MSFRCIPFVNCDGCKLHTRFSPCICIDMTTHTDEQLVAAVNDANSNRIEAEDTAAEDAYLLRYQ